MKKKLIAAVALALAPLGSGAATHATAYSRDGDPPRWYVPADTPRAKFDNASREARNALADAIKECRAARAGKRCEAQARERYHEDMARARDFLAPTRQLA
ncbi:MAG TPA: hypothetical protein VH301_07950 [Usitatibacter sp.]|nr:hypothetical protein [Usitatibacter sp.]